MTQLSATDLERELKALANPDKARELARFFKTGKGEYGEGDLFLGITVPELRKLARRYTALSLDAIAPILQSPFHESRMTALLVLTYQFPKADRRAEIVAFYLSHTEWINNWDLVDVSCRPILGVHLLDGDRAILYQLARSTSLWEQRIAIVTTMEFLKHGQWQDTWNIAEILLHHSHDLIHKAVGWALREMGKTQRSILEAFLEKYATVMPRTMLRYAIEHFNEPQRQGYLKKK